jgi:hypothetical protein
VWRLNHILNEVDSSEYSLFLKNLNNKLIPVKFGEKFSREVSSGGAFEEKSCAKNAFLW